MLLSQGYQRSSSSSSSSMQQQGYHKRADPTRWSLSPLQINTISTLYNTTDKGHLADSAAPYCYWPKGLYVPVIICLTNTIN